jgi:hypothetical protein
VVLPKHITTMVVGVAAVAVAAIMAVSIAGTTTGKNRSQVRQRVSSWLR